VIFINGRKIYVGTKNIKILPRLRGTIIRVEYVWLIGNNGIPGKGAKYIVMNNEQYIAIHGKGVQCRHLTLTKIKGK